MAKPDYLKGMAQMTAGEELIWPGGTGTLHSQDSCSLKVRTIDEDKSDAQVYATVTSGAQYTNFVLGVGLVISLTAAGSVHPVRDGA